MKKAHQGKRGSSLCHFIGRNSLKIWIEFWVGLNLNATFRVVAEFFGWCVLHQTFFDRSNKVILSGSRPPQRLTDG